MDSYQEEKTLSYSNYGDLTDIKTAVVKDAGVKDAGVKEKAKEKATKPLVDRPRPTDVKVSSYSLTSLHSDSYAGLNRNDVVSFEEDNQSAQYIALIDQDKRVTIETSEKKPEKLLNPPNVQRPPQSPITFLTTDYIGQFYVASLTVIGLYVVFRMIKPIKV